MAHPRVEEYVIDSLVASLLLLLLPSIVADIGIIGGGRGCYLDTDPGEVRVIVMTLRLWCRPTGGFVIVFYPG